MEHISDVMDGKGLTQAQSPCESPSEGGGRVGRIPILLL